MKETHLGLDQSEVNQEAIVIGTYWLSGNFALLGCNWSNKQFNGQCEPCRGLDKNGLTHQADMLWLLGLPRIKTNTSHAQPFKILLLTQLHLLHCSAKSPLQRPDKAVTGAKTSRDVAVGPCLNSTYPTCLAMLWRLSCSIFNLQAKARSSPERHASAHGQVVETVQGSS